MKIHALSVALIGGILIIVSGLVVRQTTPQADFGREPVDKQSTAESFPVHRVAESASRHADLLRSLAQRIEAELTGSWELATPSQRRSMFEQFCAELDAESVQKALLHLEHLIPEVLRPELMRALFLRLAGLAPVRAAALAGEIVRSSGAGSEAESEIITEVLLAIAKHWAGSDLLGTARWIQKWPDESARVPVAQWLLPLLEKSSPMVAGELVLSLADGPAKTEALDRLVLTWQEHDFNGALAWVKKLSDGEAQERSLLHLAHRWWQTDAAAAWGYAQNLPEGQDRLAITFVNFAIEQDPKATPQWVATLPDGIRKERVVASMTAVWAASEPRAAAEYVVNLPAGSMQQEAAISVVSAWTAQEPAMVANWVSTFPEGQTREYAIENVAIQWAATDPAATVAWLDEHLTGRDRDMAIYAGAAGLMGSHPEVAAQWTATITDQPMRDYQMERVARHWLEIESEMARRWIAQSSLPSETKDALLEFR